ncbi:MAG: threo-3-hydroxy-L-aspartate ammonia-lyase [Betaproteobacteria bacterium]|nr:threo-3-hydroxy-L-aspartate ammonia-lyase [Betaproteobacteria bacterium]
MTNDAALPVCYQDIEAAALRIAGQAHRTPVMTSSSVNERTGAQVYFKCENFQRMGAFKFRGAFNALAKLTTQERARGVIAFSSGNHAQAVALAGRELGVSAVIVMPADAPAVKLEATRGYGAEVVLYNPKTQNRESIARDIAGKRGLILIPPFDHSDIIAGQGTAAKELIEETGPLDYLFVPCGGGGLISGSALAAAALSPGCKVIGVEPEAGDDATRSFKTGKLQSCSNPDTIADGARTASLGKLTFPMVLSLVHDMTTVNDAALLSTMRYLMERMKIVVEPTGVLGAAGLLEKSRDLAGQRVGVILSGGNIDLALLEKYTRA